MSQEFHVDAYEQIRDIISRLQAPIQELPTLYGLLAAPLQHLKILPPRFIRYNMDSLLDNGLNLSKHIPALQRALLEHVLPAWATILDEEDSYAIVQQYFAPDLFSYAMPAAKEIAVYAYATILSLPLTEHSVRLLLLLTKAYSVDVLWDAVVRGRTRSGVNKHAMSWEDCVRNLSAVPGRVANAYGGHLAGSVPPDLEFGGYFNNISVRCELLLSSLPPTSTQDAWSSLSYLITKLVNISVFPPTLPATPAQPSFFLATLVTIRTRLHSTPAYNKTWSALMSSISSPMTLQAVVNSLFAHIAPIPEMDASPVTRALVKREALILKALLGPVTSDNEVLDCALACTVGRQWSIGHARVFVCWAAGSETGQTNSKGLQLLLDRVMEIWTSSDHIRHSLLAGHQYMTSLVGLIVSYLKGSTASTSPSLGVSGLARSPAFIKCISTYISHMDATVRRCGMLVAEEVAHASGKELNFKGWDGQGEGREWCRQIRELTKQRDADASLDILPSIDVTTGQDGDGPLNDTEEDNEEEVTRGVPKTAATAASSGYDSDDSLTGYISPSSSRSTSPSPTELAEIEKDPSLNVNKPKIVRPVYLAQLGEMIRPTTGVRSDTEHADVERQEMALNVAEELIRRKRAYGTELEENAVNLSYGLLGLRDNFKLAGFTEKRQDALTALVACCPRKAAPALVEQFFQNQYSADQRYVIMNALALGARELASLPVPPSTVEPKRIAFPTKHLPPALHQKYITAADQARTLNPVQNLLEGIARLAVDKSKEVAEDKVPAIARERQLRLKRPVKITDETSSATNILDRMRSTQLKPQAIVKFTDVAAEFFICPMINHFWSFLRNEQSRESMTAHQTGLFRYKGDGIGLVLNPLVLSHFVATLAVLVHAAHNAKEWLAVIAPDALELAVTIGTRPLSQSEGADIDEIAADDEDSAAGKGRKEAALLANCLELAVVIVDGCLDLDGGRSLGLEHTSLLLGAGEWGSEILNQLEKGVKVLGGGGQQEVHLKRAAAGLLLKIDELTSRWRRSMVSLGYDAV